MKLRYSYPNYQNYLGKRKSMNKIFALVIFSCTLMSNNVFSMLRYLCVRHPKARSYSSYGRPSIFTNKVYPENKEGLAELLYDSPFAQGCLRSLLLKGTKGKNKHLLKLINKQNAVIKQAEI